MAIGQSNKPNFNVQAPVANQSLVFDTNQQAFVNANISSTGSITGASNVGAGQGNVFKQLSGTDLQFKTLTQGNNVTIADGTDSITISANGVVTTAENLGSGTGLFAQLNSGTGKVQFKGLVAGTGIALANNSTDVTVSIDASTVDAATLGGNAASVFLTKADNLASVGSLSTARDNLSVYSKAEGDARYYRQAADILPDADNTRSLGSNSNRFSDIYAVDIHGTVTTAGQVTSLANQDIGNLRDVDTTGVASNSILKWNGTKWAIAVDAGGITTLNALTDVDTTGAVNSSVLKYNASSGQWEVGSDVSGGGGGASTFVGLTDTPNNFVGAGSKFVKVNSGGNALEFTTVDTDGIAEGTNLYFTNARADARIGAANISDLSDVHTAAPTDGQVLKWDNANSYWKPAADSTYTNFNTDFDNRLATKNTDNLTEGSSNLYFTNARWDARLGTKSTTDLTEGSNLYYTDARVNTRVNALGKANWDTAYGWGDHGAAGYQTAAGLNGAIDSHLNQSGPTSGYVLSWNGSDYAWVAQSGGSALTIQDEGSALSTAATTINFVGAGVTATGAGATKTITINGGGGGSSSFVGLSDTPANFTGGANKFVKVNGAGNALEYVADPGYLTSVPAQSFASLTGKPTTIAGYGITDAFSGAYADLTGKPTLFDNSAFDTRLATKDTGDLAEGSNLYFTNARADARINLQTGANLNLGSKDTDDLSEGSSNLYFTNARARSAISATGSVSYNAGTGVITYTQGNTDTVAEGSTNLYFTNARADARIGAASINALSDVSTGGVASGQFLKWNGTAWVPSAVAQENLGDNVISDLSDVHNASPTNGQGLIWDNANSYWKPANLPGTGTVTGITAGTGLTGGTINISGTIAVDVGTSANKIVQLDGSAKLPAVDGSALTNITYTVGVDEIKDTMIDFGTGTGQVSTSDLPEGTNLYYTDGRFDTRLATKSTTNLSEGTNLYFTNARADARITAAGSANWNTAYGWGDHGAAGYQTAAGLNGAIDSHLNQSGPTSGYVLSWNGSDYAWVAQSSGGSVAGSNTQVQFNDGGSFGADSGLTFNKSTDTLTAGSFTTSGASPKLSSTAALTIESGSNNDITITPNGSGDIILDGQKWPQADGSAGQYLKTDGAGQLSWSSVTGGPADTDALSEGSTNLYFTNSRAISAVQGTSLNMGSNNITTTGKILYSNVYNNTGDLPSASTYHGMFAHVHGTGKGYFAHAGNWIPLANESALSSYQTTAGLNAAIDSHLNQSGPTSGYVLSWNGSDYAWVAQSGGGPADTDALSEGSSNLYFTNARADARITAAIKDEDNMASDSATHVPSQQSVKAYVDAQVATKDNTDEITEGSTNLYFTNARADARIGAADIADLNNVNNAAPTDGQVLTWDNANSYWKPATAGGGGGGTDVQRFKINYATNGQLSSITDKTSGISSVSIDSAAGGDITINFTGYSYPPASITLYGYNYPSNKYNVNPLNKDITLREIPGGGSSGSPTAFGSFASVKIKAAEGDSGASRSFGTVTHAWVQVVMGG